MSGRGAYYKNKYGNRSGRGGGRSNDSGRGRGRSGGSGSGGPFPKRGRFEGVSQLTVGGSFVDLARLLESIDGRNYPTYHDLEREWHHDEKANNKFSLRIGRAQSDPFAPPTWCQIRIPATEFVDNWPETLRDNPVARVAASDFLLRHLYRTCQSLGADKTVRTGGGSGWSGPKGGDLQILAPTQHVLEQSAVQIAKADNGTNQTDVVLQMTVNLPARGRTILGYAAKEIFCNILPQLVAALLALPTKPLWDHVHLIEDQVWLQNQLAAWGLVAFIPNGSILPRRSGVDDRPLLDAVPFSSPPNLECSFDLPNTNNTIIGMGIPEGVTLICGGGFHGKSTLLQALQWGIYPKIQGDGREFCVVRPLATSIRAEDGRSVQSVNIADFLRDLPGKAKDTTCFSTENASGSTSQASSIVEAVELGAEVLLMDEDTCATNFMIRDSKMMQLVATGKEPITPFVRVVRSLYEQRSISTILVMGGSGDYFDVADHVLVMDSYECQDATNQAKEIVAKFASSSTNIPEDASSKPLCLISARSRMIAHSGQIQANGKVKAPRTGLISYGNTEIDLTSVEQIVSPSQTLAIANILGKVGALDDGKSVVEALQFVDNEINQNGLEILAPGQYHGGLTRPRPIEAGAALNRLRIAGSITQAK